ncbi:glycosyltransferase family 25 protein [Aeromonas allosaccharophila]|uniref:glycosyltransferase family 25 protein n=1 Tax=Aeromonas allosaccharophila TaxID=656 RepID=UPI003D1BC6C4
MKIYVVSLERSCERRERITKHLSGLGIAFEFFSAVDGRAEQTPGYDDEQRIKEKGHSLTLGEKGCFASHRALWEKCILLKEPMLILEDDVDFSDAFINCLKGLDEVVSRYSYVRLGRGPLKKMPIFGAHYSMQHLDGVNGHAVVKYLRGPSCCHGYALSPAAAEKFLSYSESWWWPVDDYMDSEHIHGVCDYGIEPPIVLQTDLPSEIGYSERENKGKRSLFSRARKEVFRFRGDLLSYLFNITTYIKNSRR